MLRQNLMAIERINVLGVGISVLNLGTALTAMAEAVRTRRKGYICVTGVHGVMEAQADAAFKTILNAAFLCTPDGMPMVWAGKLNGQRAMRRVYGPDLMLEVCAWSETSGAKHFFYGGADGVAELLAQKLKEKFPKLSVAGTFTPPFRALNEGEVKQLQAQIRAAQPNIGFQLHKIPQDVAWASALKIYDAGGVAGVLDKEILAVQIAVGNGVEP